MAQPVKGGLRGLALDYGASSGRAILGRFDGKRLSIKEIHRFANEPVKLPDALYWDAPYLYQQMLEGIFIACASVGAPDSIGVDTWGVDFGMLDRDGRLVANPTHYRDTRTNGMMEEAFQRMTRARIFKHTGLAFMQINTLYQLLSMEASPLRQAAYTILMMPDLLTYFLTGEQCAEYTIASTSQLTNPVQRDWSRQILSAFGLPRSWFPDITEPGAVIGQTRADVNQRMGLSKPIPVAAVGSHDTASAVCALPVDEKLGGRFAYISSGTWSLLGAETDQPIINDAVLTANYTNEGGVFGKTRALKNIMGLWILQECRRVWQREGITDSFATLADKASLEKPFLAFFDPDSERFLPPGDMPGRIAQACRETGQPVPETPAQTARVIYENLALKYRWAINQLSREILGERIDRVYIVGGGSNNALLNRMTAQSLGIPVYAGPDEASAIGNLLTQASALGELKSLSEIRSVVRASFAPKLFEPSNRDEWDDAYARFLKATGLRA
ncbi:MAG: rhamnulokinase [Oscillospiraceae bacterium]|nr:rhamnulokinase [Oscillospiraceae bacterium]